VYGKRDPAHQERGLFTQQKRPVHIAKETCAHSKRGLFTQQKRPVHTGIPVPHPQHPVSREEAEAAEAVETLVLPVGLTNV